MSVNALFECVLELCRSLTYVVLTDSRLKRMIDIVIKYRRVEVDHGVMALVGSLTALPRLMVVNGFADALLSLCY